MCAFVFFPFCQSCQILYSSQNPAGTEDTTFSVDSEGNVVIKYGEIKGSDNKLRYDTVCK